jgi:hypothetical protein
MVDSLITKAVGGVSAGIGLVSESITAKKKHNAAKKLAAERKSAAESSHDASRSIDSGKSKYFGGRDEGAPSDPCPTYEEAIEEHDDEQWDLDDAQSDLKLPLPEERSSPPARDHPELSTPAEKPIRDMHKLTDAFIAKHAVSEFISEAEKMGLPVVLPR